MDNFVAVISIVGGIAGVIGLLLPAQGVKSRVMHGIYGLAIAILASLTMRYHTRIDALTAIEKDAQTFVSGNDYHTSAQARGFILAALSFLEKHKDKLPDTYARAVLLAENSGVLINKQDDGMERLTQGWSMLEAADAMKQLIRGIASNRQNN